MTLRIKYIILFILAGAIFSAPAFADSIRWEDSYEAALKLAARDDKPVMAFLYTTWCPWCVKLSTETLTDRAVVAASGEFVCLKVDADKRREIARGYGIGSFPTILFLDPSGRVIWMERGFREAPMLSGRMAEVVSAFKQNEAVMPYLKSALEAANRGDLDRAIAIIDDVIRIYPNEARLYTARGVIYMNKGDVESALVEFDRSLSINPNNYYIYAIRAQAYFMMKDYDKSWYDVNELERRGYRVNPEFLEKLKAASGREK